MDIGRDEARELARDELRDPVYDIDESLTDRVLRWIVEQLSDLFDGISVGVNTPSGLAIVIAIVVVAALIVILRSGPLALRAARAKRGVFDAERSSAQTYRDRAEAASSEHDWSRAVIERFRAIVATAEERGVIDERPGRTADEAARDTGAELRHLAARLAAAASTFDDVRYGDQHGDESGYVRMYELDDAVSTTDIGSEPEPEVASTGPAVPR